MKRDQKLPIGIQDFEKLRKDGCVYVDKTAHIYQLAQRGKPYFLARPARFGKSLLLSTMNAYFSGKRELFSGLAIEKLETRWERYPVFHLNMNVEFYKDMETFMSSWDTNLSALEAEWGRDEAELTLPSRFQGLIKRACQQTGKGVVILVDEYDKPLLHAMDDEELRESILVQLRGFYGVLKTADPYLHFVFFTGSTTSVYRNMYSSLNQLWNISMDEQYIGICGITDAEVADRFDTGLRALGEKEGATYEETVAKMRWMYGGYRFSKEAQCVYNPFCILNTFAKLNYGYYWFYPSNFHFWIRNLKMSKMYLPSFEGGIFASQTDLIDYRLEEGDNIISFMFQSGYLTIRDYVPAIGLYTLGFPNEEIRLGFLKALLPIYLPEGNNQRFKSVVFLQDLYRGDVEGFMARLQACLSDADYALEDKTECFYQTALYLIFSLMSESTDMKRQTAKGSASFMVGIADIVYLFEFKMPGYGIASEALRQIDEGGSLAGRDVRGKQLVKIGAAFGKDRGTLSEWLVERHSASSDLLYLQSASR
ncbi:MAG: ATP-binding protein [Mediterranea sp.]|jgi:hypothetical protein|nr:ATP-binding protein [Mediterranea sp.]